MFCRYVVITSNHVAYVRNTHFIFFNCSDQRSMFMYVADILCLRQCRFMTSARCVVARLDDVESGNDGPTCDQLLASRLQSAAL